MQLNSIKHSLQAFLLHALMLRNTLTLVGTNREPASHGEGAMRKMSVQAVLLSRAIRQRGCNVAILKVPAKLEGLLREAWGITCNISDVGGNSQQPASEILLCSSAMCITCASNPIHCCVQKLASRGELAKKTLKPAPKVLPSQACSRTQSNTIHWPWQKAAPRISTWSQLCFNH